MMIKLELPLEGVQLILNGLGNLPFGQVEALVAEVRNQTVPQVNQERELPQDPPNNEAA